jgi:hypothetical protein
VTPSQNVIDTLRLPKNFDLDDLNISHDSDYSDSNEGNGHLTQILQGVIDELIDETNQKAPKNDDL